MKCMKNRKLKSGQKDKQVGYLNVKLTTSTFQRKPTTSDCPIKKMAYSRILSLCFWISVCQNSKTVSTIYLSNLLVIFKEILTSFCIALFETKL